MKRLIIPLLAIFLFASCTNEETIPIEKIESQNLSFKKKELNFEQTENLSRKFVEFKQANEAREQKRIANGLKADCQQTVFVPDDYPTIQEAIDAVCDYGNVFVRSGVYNESPGTETPGIFIKAIGDVTLKGGFGLGTDNVKIHGFKIDNAYSQWAKVGIASAPGFNGFDIKNNTIYSTENINTPGLPFGHIGIYFEYCDNARIVQNTISGNMEVGIYIDAIRLDFPGSPPHPFGSSNNNTISNNTVTDIYGDLDVLYPGTCIQLRGDTDNTLVNGNYTENTNGWGISLWSFQELDKNCDNNIVKNNSIKNTLFTLLEIYFGGSNNTLKNNTVTNSETVGIEIWGSENKLESNHVTNARDVGIQLWEASNITVGPDNVSNDNGNFGILLYLSENNVVFDNTFINNGFCDIYNFPGSDNNQYINNTANCAWGVN